MTDEIKITVANLKEIEFYGIPGKDLEDVTPEDAEAIRAAKDPIGEAMKRGYNVSVANNSGVARATITD